MAPMSLRQAAELIGAEIDGDDGIEITGIAPLSEAGPGQLSLFMLPRYAEALRRTRAAAIITGPDAVRPDGKTFLRTTDPRAAWARMIRAFHPLPAPRRGISPAAHIDPSAEVSEEAFVGAGAVIGGRSRIEAGAQIMPGAIIGEDCRVGEGTTIHSGAVLYPDSIIGRRCILHANCVIGRDGFGFHRLASGELLPVPQVGRVEIADDVEIGACACVDRATLSVTEIGAGAKIDNQVHVAHNSRVGRDVLIAGQSVLAGSTSVGDGSTLWGRAALVDGVRLGPRTTMQVSAVAAASHPGGETLAGHPAIPARLWVRCVAAYKRLPDLVKLLPKRP